VHRRRDEDGAQRAVDGRRDAHVAMGEVAQRNGRDVGRDHRPDRRAQRDDGGDHRDVSGDRLDRVEAQADREVVVDVAVVDAVQPPQHRHPVPQPVIAVAHRVERDERQREGGGGRERDDVHESPAALGREPGGCAVRDRQQERQDAVVERQQPQVRRPALAQRRPRGACRGERLPGADDREPADERAEVEGNDEDGRVHGTSGTRAGKRGFPSGARATCASATSR